MQILIKNQSELPIYAQIETQIKEQILSGELPEGTLLPSIRKLAKEIGVSVITTARAYNDPEAAGFIVSVQGKGSIVRSQSNALLREHYLKRIEEHLQEAITVAGLIGISREELARMLDALYDQKE